MERYRQVRCNWGIERKILTHCSARKQKQSGESLTVLGGHLDLRVTGSLLPLAPLIHEHFTAHKYVVTSPLSATQMLPLGQKGMVI